MAQFQGLVGPQVYRTEFGPSYRVSYSASVGLLGVTVVSVCIAWFLVRRQDASERTKLMCDSENVGCSDEKPEEGGRSGGLLCSAPTSLGVRTSGHR